METDNTGTVQATYTYGNDLVNMNRAGTVLPATCRSLMGNSQKDWTFGVCGNYLGFWAKVSLYSFVAESVGLVPSSM
jgi:hypothetical protein